MSRTKGPVAQKDLKTYPVEDYQYMVVRPNERQAGMSPRYGRNLDEAKKKVSSDLNSWSKNFERIGAMDSIKAVARARKALEGIPLAGGRLDFELDPVTGTRYKVDIIRREAVS